MIRMKMAIICFLLVCTAYNAYSQTKKKFSSNKINNESIEKELKAFFDDYAEDLRKHKKEEIANRYDTRGYYRMGNGAKSFRSFVDNKKRYLTQWSGPKSFEWKDLSIDILSPTSALVLALFDWEPLSGEKETFSYTGVLTKQSGSWRIRVEDESVSPVNYSTKIIAGDRSKPGPIKYSLTAKPGAMIAPVRHSVDMNIRIISGRKFIVMGDLDTARVQRVDAGSSLIIPAKTWHVQWWEIETVEEIEVIVPMRTERATSASPRKH